MRLLVHNVCSDFDSYRAARVKSLFNVDTGCNFTHEAHIPMEEEEWKIGVIVGPSGSGKTSLGKLIFGDPGLVWSPEWPADMPLVDAIAPDGNFDEVTGSLAAVGLGTVPAWLRPYPVLSNGEKFRADLAKLITEKPERAVVDEFSSVVDRQIATIAAGAFAKAWRRTGGQVVLLSCHYDILDWVEPDWVYDTATGKYSGRGLHRRPRFELEIWKTDGSYWGMFEPHHYLKLPRMVAAQYYVGFVDGEAVAHLCISPKFEIKCFRACRMVVMPEWQGAGIGMRFLNGICELMMQDVNRWERKLPTLFHTSHPGLVAALRRDPSWKQVSQMLCGDSRKKSILSLDRARKNRKSTIGTGSGYGGHFRAVQGFKYLGKPVSA